VRISGGFAKSYGESGLSTFAQGTTAGRGSALDGYSQSDNSQHVNFVDDKGHVHELYRNPAAQWVDNDLTALSAGTGAQIDSALHGYSQGDSSQHVDFVDGIGHVNELYLAP
jgi:hypothetical protein